MDSKDQLDGAGEIERVVEVAGRAMPVIADCPERVLDLARDPADGAEQVPEQDKQPFVRAMKAGRDELVRVKAKALSQRQGSDPGDFRIRSLAQEFAQPIGHSRFDVALRQPVEPLLEAGPLRGREPGRFLEGVDGRRSGQLADDDRIDPLINPLKRPASLAAKLEVREQASANAPRQEPDLMHQPGSAAAAWLKFDKAQEPLENSLLEFTQDAESLALNPLERMFPPREGNDPSKPGIALHASFGGDSRGELRGGKAERSVHSLGVGNMRPELAGRGLELPDPVKLDHVARVALGKPRMERERRRRAMPQRLQVAEHRRGIGVAVFRPLCHGLLHDPRRSLAHGLVESAKHRDRLLAMLDQQLISGRAQERRPSRQRVKERGSHRVDIGAGVDRRAVPLLGGHVMGRSHQGPGRGHRQRLRINNVPGQAKIRELDTDRCSGIDRVGRSRLLAAGFGGHRQRVEDQVAWNRL